MERCARPQTVSPMCSRPTVSGRGDRVAILLPQMPAVAASHIAIYKLGAIALPLAMLFGLEAISYRLADSGARALITNTQGLAKLAPLRERLHELALVLSLDGAAEGARGFRGPAGARLPRVHSRRYDGPKIQR